MSEYHVPVLLEESISGLNIKPGGIYLDLTFGGGGHSREILNRLGKKGYLMGFDQDEDAMQNVPDDERFIFVNHNFRYLRNFMRYYGLEEADGILADLGVSSHEFDEADRGFSFRFDAELDMRMNRRSRFTAAEVLNTNDEQRLCALFRTYGESCRKGEDGESIGDFRRFISGDFALYSQNEGREIFGESVSGFADRGKRGVGSPGGNA